MRRRNYLRALGGLPLVAAGAAGCLSSGTNGSAERALTAQQLGEAWTYTETGSPTVTEKGTIVANYRASDPYSRTVRLRLWPCEGETLEALGGTCSLGGLPDQKRANESVETADRSLGETAFLWWSGEATDIEVVTANHVFRLTHTLAGESDTDTSQELPSRDARVKEVTDIARLQTEKLARKA
jgi:hypothetical protein